MKYEPFDVHVERTKRIVRQLIDLKPGGMRGWLSRVEGPVDLRSFKNMSSVEHHNMRSQQRFSESKNLLRRTHIDRNDLCLGPPGDAQTKGYRNWPYYSEAILHVLEEARRLPTMRCMSCATPTPQTKVFGKLLVCEQCLELAKKSQKEIFDKIEAAKVVASNWLENHILSGGLLKGSDGIPSTGLPIHVQTAVQELQGRKAAPDGGVPLRAGKRSAT